MKRILSFAIILVFVFSLAACKQQTAAVDPTEIPARPTEAAEEVPTEAPTEVPTETPTEAATPAPTETPTPEPTETPTPEPAELAFEDCAEEVLRLVPYKAYDGPLPADAAENEVLYFINDDSEICNYGPLTFAVDGETTVVCDTGYMLMRGLFVYNEEGRLVSRCEAWLTGYRVAALSSGVLYTPDAAVDINTGEVLVEFLFDEDSVEENMQMVGSTPRLLLSRPFNESGVYTLSYDYNAVNAEGIWEATDHVCNMIEDRDGKWTKFVFANGSALTLDNVGYSVIGADSDGNVYLDHVYNGHTLIKLSPDGIQLSRLELPFNKADLWEPGFLLTLMEDGTVYAAVPFNESFVIYRIDL